MSNQQRNARVVLTYTVDQASLDYIKQSVNTVNALLENIVGANDAVGASAVEAGAKITSSFGDADLAAINNLRDSMGELADETERAKAAAADGGFSLPSGLSRGFSAAGQLARQAGAPELGGGLQVTGELLRTEQGLQRISAILPALNQSLVDSGGLIPPLTGGLVELGVPMAGILGTLGPLVPVAVAAVAIFTELNGVFQDGVSGVKNAEVELAAYYGAIEKGTTETLKAQIAVLQQQQGDAQAQADQYQQSLKSGLEQSRQGLVGVATGVLGDILHVPADYIATLSPPMQELAKQFNDATDKANKLGQQIQGLQSALNSGDVAINDAIASDKARVAFALQAQQLINDGTSKQVLAQVNQNKLTISGNNELLAMYSKLDQSNANVKTSEQDLTDQNALLAGQNTVLLTTVLPLVQAHEQLTTAADAETAALKKDADQRAADAKKIADDQDRYSNDLAAINAQAGITRRDDGIKLSRDLVDIDSKGAEERASIALKLKDKLASIDTDIAQGRADEATKLREQQADALTSLNRDLVKITADGAYQEQGIEIKTQRQEAQDLQAHLQSLQQIRDQAKAQETQDLLDRSFLGLLKDRLGEATNIRSEDTRFSGQEQQRATDEKNQEADLQRSLEQQRAQRRVSYGNTLIDEQTQDTRQLAALDLKLRREDEAARLADSNSLRDLNIKIVNERGAKLVGYGNEMSDLNQHIKDELNAKRLAFQNELALIPGALIPYLSAQPGGLFGMDKRADGGSAVPGNAYLVNDKYPGQRESVNGVPLPSSALGYYIPLQPGYVSSGSSGGATNLTIHATFTGITEQQAAMQTVKLIGKLVNHK